MNRSRIKASALIAIVSLFLVTACSTQRFAVNGMSESGSTEVSQFFVLGVAQVDTVDAAAICQGSNNIIAVQTKDSFFNVLLRTLTFGIYAPRDYKVSCRG
ncbi:MAG: lipoprotein bor [Alphaproteobacteria bacterium]|nr:lipoprotein bor [Alphaproteobacteria bacterium]